MIALRRTGVRSCTTLGLVGGVSDRALTGVREEVDGDSEGPRIFAGMISLD